MGYPPSGYAHVNRYWFTTPEGEKLFAKDRFELLDPISGDRSKTFRYWDPVGQKQKKPDGADSILYRLDLVVPAVCAGHAIHWAEGEKDADALVAAGVVGTSHHQGAGRVTLDQAAWLAGARQVVLWVDKDVDRWEVGAYDACLRHNLLIEAGVPATHIRFVKACGPKNKDAADHIAAGYSVDQARRVDAQRLVAVARQYRPSAARRAGYRRG